MIDVSPFVETLDGKPVAVFGLARSGLATIKAFKAAGSDVIAWDDNEEAREKASALGAGVEVLSEDVLASCGCLVLAPGVPYTHNPHPVVLAAQAVGTKILGDIEVFYTCKGKRKIVGITGTNGKSTTTALLGHVLKTCGVSSVYGGNIGVPVFEMGMPEDGGVIVLELSSYQMDLVDTFTADIGVILNITPDHIDRHGTVENYMTSKFRLFEGAGVTVCGNISAVADPVPLPPEYEDAMNADNYFVIRKGESENENVVWTKGREVFNGLDGSIGIVEDVPTLAGVHNMQNVAAVFAVAHELGVDSGDILAAVATYPGLPHRQFPVRMVGHVLYVNDSKATNAESAARALACYEDIYWIIGGQAKEGGLSGLEGYMPRVRHAFVIGEAADEFIPWLEKNGVVYTHSGTLAQAVTDAHEASAGKSGVVLLSPACASFDQFPSFEHRGNEFTALVGGWEE